MFEVGAAIDNDTMRVGQCAKIGERRLSERESAGLKMATGEWWLLKDGAKARWVAAEICKDDVICPSVLMDVKLSHTCRLVTGKSDRDCGRLLAAETIGSAKEAECHNKRRN